MNDALGIAENIYNGQVAAGLVDVLDNRTAYKSSFITYKGDKENQQEVSCWLVFYSYISVLISFSEGSQIIIAFAASFVPESWTVIGK